MKFYKFVSWEVEEAEAVIKRAKIPAAMIEADKGNYKPLKECYKQYLSLEHLTNPVYKLSGWAFSLREYCRRYWVKVRYYGIMELYAPNKTAVYNILGRYNVLEIHEVEQ